MVLVNYNPVLVNEKGAFGPKLSVDHDTFLYERIGDKGICRLRVGHRQPRADSQCSEPTDRIAARAPVRELPFVEALGHARVPFAGLRPDHRAGIELAIIDPHRAAEAAADLERRLDDVLRARRAGTGSKCVTFRGGVRRAIPFLLVGKVLNFMPTKVPSPFSQR